MIKIILAALIGISVFSLNAQEIQWPPLPDSGFIEGRAAEQKDIAAGNAAFVAAVNGVSIGKPLDIGIPQYAYYNDAGVKIPVIIIQAEEAQGQKILGARQANGGEIVGQLTDFELLGRKTPK